MPFVSPPRSKLVDIEAVPGMRARALRHRRMLAWGFLASTLAHTAILAVLPGPGRFSESEQQLRPLEVIVLRQDSPPEPLRVEPAAPPPTPRPKAPPVPVAEQRLAPTKTFTDPKPVLAVPAAAAPAEPASIAPSPLPSAEPKQAATAASPSSVPAEREPVAVTPPNFSAQYLRNSPPAYPATARRNGEEGTVRLKVLVTRDGRAAQVELEQASGSRALDSAAVEAVKRWQFVPARRGTESIESWVSVPVIFKLSTVG
jgi:protein TonB